MAIPERHAVLSYVTSDSAMKQYQNKKHSTNRTYRALEGTLIDA